MVKKNEKEERIHSVSSCVKSYSTTTPVVNKLLLSSMNPPGDCSHHLYAASRKELPAVCIYQAPRTLSAPSLAEATTAYPTLEKFPMQLSLKSLDQELHFKEPQRLPGKQHHEVEKVTMLMTKFGIAGGAVYLTYSQGLLEGNVKGSEVLSKAKSAIPPAVEEWTKYFGWELPSAPKIDFSPTEMWNSATACEMEQFFRYTFLSLQPKAHINELTDALQLVTSFTSEALQEPEALATPTVTPQICTARDILLGA
ncbi:MIC13 protein, partial [Polypterus senegalus]